MNFLNPFPQFLDSDANPLTGGSVSFFETGTVTPKTIFTDRSLTIPAQNPQPLNVGGLAEQGSLYLGPGAYKIVLRNVEGTVVNTVDPFTGGIAGSSQAVEFLSVKTVRNLYDIQPTVHTIALVSGYYEVGDNGGGIFVFEPVSQGVDDGGSIITPLPAQSYGRWHRQFDGHYSIRYWGGGYRDYASDNAVINSKLYALNNNVKITYDSPDIAFANSITLENCIIDTSTNLSAFDIFGIKTITIAKSVDIETKKPFFSSSGSVSVVFNPREVARTSWFSMSSAGTDTLYKLSGADTLIVSGKFFDFDTTSKPNTTFNKIKFIEGGGINFTGNSMASIQDIEVNDNSPVISGNWRIKFGKQVRMSWFDRGSVPTPILKFEQLAEYNKSWFWDTNIAFTGALVESYDVSHYGEGSIAFDTDFSQYIGRLCSDNVTISNIGEIGILGRITPFNFGAVIGNPISFSHAMIRIGKVHVYDYLDLCNLEWQHHYNGFFSINSDCKIKNGSIRISDSSKSLGSFLFMLPNETKFHLENVDIFTNSYGFIVSPEASNITIKNCKLEHLLPITDGIDNIFVVSSEKDVHIDGLVTNANYVYVKKNLKINNSDFTAQKTYFSGSDSHKHYFTNTKFKSIDVQTKFHIWNGVEVYNVDGNVNQIQIDNSQIGYNFHLSSVDLIISNSLVTTFASGSVSYLKATNCYFNLFSKQFTTGSITGCEINTMNLDAVNSVILSNNNIGSLVPNFDRLKNSELIETRNYTISNNVIRSYIKLPLPCSSVSIVGNTIYINQDQASAVYLTPSDATKNKYSYTTYGLVIKGNNLIKGNTTVSLPVSLKTSTPQGATMNGDYYFYPMTNYTVDVDNPGSLSRVQLSTPTTSI